jgi:hypothetical protein
MSLSSTLSPRFPTRPQATMVATWLTELLLDRLNRALLQRGPAADEPAAPQDGAQDEAQGGGEGGEEGDEYQQVCAAAASAGRQLSPKAPSLSAESRAICGGCQPLTGTCAAVAA